MAREAVAADEVSFHFTVRDKGEQSARKTEDMVRRGTYRQRTFDTLIGSRRYGCEDRAVTRVDACRLAGREYVRHQYR